MVTWDTMKKDLFIWAILYVLCMGALTWGMFRARESATATYGTEAARQEWETWREDVRQLPPNETPTKRDVPKSDLPPAFVLMRDHFTSCLSLALILTSALFFTMMMVTRGAMRPTIIRED